MSTNTKTAAGKLGRSSGIAMIAAIVATAAAAPGSAQACDDEYAGPWVDLEMARAIENRQPVDTAEPFMDGETVYAWSNVHDYEGGEVEHVWKKGDRELARYTLKIDGNRWRTWSRHRLRPGRYTVEVLAAGVVLESRDIEVARTTASR